MIYQTNDVKLVEVDRLDIQTLGKKIQILTNSIGVIRPGPGDQRDLYCYWANRIRVSHQVLVTSFGSQGN